MSLSAFSACTLLPRTLALTLLLLANPALAHDSLFIGFAQDSMRNAWRRAQVEEVKNTLSQYPEVRFEYTDAQGSTALQALHIEDLVHRGIDLLITSPRDRQILSPVIEQVYSQGIPVILLSRAVDTDQYTSFIHPLNLDIGKAAGEYLVERLEGRGRILMLEGVPGASTTLLRTQGFMETVGEYPEISVSRHVGNYLRSDAMKVTESLLEKGERFDAIYAHSDIMALAAVSVLRRHGIDPASLTIAGIDYISESREAIRRGDLTVTFTYPTGAEEGVSTAMDVLKGKSVPKAVIIDSIRVTRDNVDEVEPIF